MSENRVLVVGTTYDYIEYINNRYPNRAIFLTDESVCVNLDKTNFHDSIIIGQLSDFEKSLNLLEEYLMIKNQKLSGITCFDCEWLYLASMYGDYFKLPFPSGESIRITRDKYLSKQIWTENNVPCPKTVLVYNGCQSLKLIDDFKTSIVLKPLTGSGSEFTYLCHDIYDVSTSYRNIITGLANSKDNPLYKIYHSNKNHYDIKKPILAEEYIEGTEYSADFIISGERIKLIRTAEKVQSKKLPFGATMAYVVPAKISDLMDEDVFTSKLLQAAKALGLTKAICMVDFIYKDQEIYFLELTPRIGGDCLPPLVRYSSNIDTIKVALDFAENKKIKIPTRNRWSLKIGLRLFGTKEGKLSSVDFSKILEDSRIKEIYLKYDTGHEIILPPKNYCSWILGHVIFEPIQGVNMIKQCYEISDKISVNLEESYDEEYVQLYNSFY